MDLVRSESQLHSNKKIIILFYPNNWTAFSIGHYREYSFDDYPLELSFYGFEKQGWDSRPDLTQSSQYIKQIKVKYGFPTHLTWDLTWNAIRILFIPILCFYFLTQIRITSLSDFYFSLMIYIYTFLGAQILISFSIVVLQSLHTNLVYS